MKKSVLLLIIIFILGTAFIVNNNSKHESYLSDNLKNSIETSPDIAFGCPFRETHCLETLREIGSARTKEEAKAKALLLCKRTINWQSTRDELGKCVIKNTLKCTKADCTATITPLKDTIGQIPCKITYCGRSTPTSNWECIAEDGEKKARINCDPLKPN